jgi:hypothetical protein
VPGLGRSFTLIVAISLKSLIAITAAYFAPDVEVELKFLDMPDAPDLERVFSTSQQQMLAAEPSQGPEYKFVRDAD